MQENESDLSNPWGWCKDMYIFYKPYQPNSFFFKQCEKTTECRFWCCLNINAYKRLLVYSTINSIIGPDKLKRI